MDVQKYTHIVYLNPSVNDVVLPILSQYCGKDSVGKPVLTFFCSEIDDNHPFYLKVTVCYSNNASQKLKIPHSLIILIHEQDECQENTVLPFGFVPL